MRAKPLLTAARHWLAAAAWCAAAVSASGHPLDPLSPAELSSVAQIIRKAGRADSNRLFVSIALKEPPKEEVLRWNPGAPSRREGFAVVLDRPANRTYEAVVDLAAHSLVSWTPVPGVQPMWTAAEDAQAMDLVRADPEWRAAMARRGITNVAEVAIVTWMPGRQPSAEPANGRFFRTVFYNKGAAANYYGPPIEGVEAVVDVTRNRIAQVIDTGVRPVARESTDFFDPKVRGSGRPALKPLLVSQPEGPGFEIDGNEIRWDRWRFRFGFNPREGLVLHQIRFNDAGRERSVLYRAAVSELLVPYGDPSQTWFWRNAVDEGEYGLGSASAPFLPGRNTASGATLLEVPMADNSGAAASWPARIDVYEREGDTLWTHYDGYAQANEARRSRELLIGFIATVGNYDYSWHWVFRQDASIEFVAELTGIILTKGVAATACEACLANPGKAGDREPLGEDRYGTVVAPHIVGVNHQHFVNVRLDFDVDGASNSLQEINVQPAPAGPANPGRNAFIAVPTVFGREQEAARDVNPASHRTWAVFNPNVTTALGHHPAYVLDPGMNTWPFLPPDGEVRQSAGFVDHHLFGTRFHASELYAAGPYPSGAPRPENIVSYGADNESILNQDVVLWYTFGLTHVPRPEDFPVMPAVRTGFKLVPKGFFTRNPAMDVPAPAAPR